MADGEAPSNAAIDALFEGARGALIRARAPMTIDPAKGPVLLEVGREELGELRRTLAIVESDERFFCMCKGDYAIELRGLVLARGLLSFHHGISVRLAGWCSDAKLEDGPALFRFLAQRGITEPLEAYEQGLVAAVEGDRARDRWVEAIPEPLRDLAADLERDSSESKVKAALDALGRDAGAARALFRWLAIGQERWSGYPVYETVPTKLLEAIPASPLLEAASADLTDAEVRGATRYFGSHDVVSFRKSILGELPPALFDRARPLWQAANDEDVMQRFDYAVRLAADTRAAKGRRGPYARGEYVVLGESIDGPLSGLAALADGTLVSVDVRRVLRFAPDRVAGELVAEASEHFVVLGAAGDRIAWATMNAGEVFEQRGAGPIERLASGQRVPVEMTVSGEHTAWLSRDAPGGSQIMTPSGALVQMSGIHGLVSDGAHVYFVCGGGMGGKIHRVAWSGGDVEKVAAQPDHEFSTASPAMAASRGELLVVANKSVRAIDPSTGRSRNLLEAPHTVRAVASDSVRVALLIGEEDEDWFFASASRDGGAVKKLARFVRAPYFRHPLLIARGHAITVWDDRLIGVPLDG